MTRRSIANVLIDFDLTMSDLLTRIRALLLEPGIHLISTTNAEFIMEAQKDTTFKNIINSADLSVPDGAGVLFADKYLQGLHKLRRDFLFPIKSLLWGIFLGIISLFKKGYVGIRLSGVDLVYKLCEVASQEHYTVFLLGGRKKDGFGNWVDGEGDLATQCAERLHTIFPGLTVVGATSAYSPYEKDDIVTLNYIQNCMHTLNITSLDFIFVAYGHGNQEKWIKRNTAKIPAKISIGVGGTFDYIVGTQVRCPKRLIDLNLEWLFRLVTQPWRYKRIFTAFPVFPLFIYLFSIRNPFK